jgi:hypothetical protein
MSYKAWFSCAIPQKRLALWKWGMGKEGVGVSLC